jgi:hypothetical protein
MESAPYMNIDLSIVEPFTVDNPKYCETPNEPHRTYGSLGGQDINIIYQFRKYIDHLNGKRRRVISDSSLGIIKE